MLFPSRKREFISGSRNAVPESQICPREISKSRVSIKAAILAGIAAVFSMSPCDAEARPKQQQKPKPAVAVQLPMTADEAVFVVVPEEEKPEGHLLQSNDLGDFVDDPSTSWCDPCMIRVRCQDPKITGHGLASKKIGSDVLIGPMRKLYGREIKVQCAGDSKPRVLKVPLPAPLQQVSVGNVLSGQEAQRAEPKQDVGSAAARRQGAQAAEEGRGQGQVSAAPTLASTAVVEEDEEVGHQPVVDAGAQVESQEQGLFSEDHSLVAEVGAVTPIVSGGDFFGQPLSSAGVYVAFGRELNGRRGDFRGTLRIRQISQGITEQDNKFRPVDTERRLSGFAIDCRLGANVKRRIAQTGAVRVDVSAPVGIGWSVMHVEGAFDAAVGKQPPFEFADVPDYNAVAVGIEACPGIAVGGDRVKAVLRVCGSMLAPVQKRAGDEVADMVFAVDGEVGMGGNF